MKIAGLFLGLAVAAMGASAQIHPTEQKQTQQPIYTYRVTVTSRTAVAVNYRHRSGATKVNFSGTDLLPQAHGQAKVESKQGYIEIEVEFDGLVRATTFGREYLTYVLWAITPEGRSVNLGEILLNGNRSKLNVTTDLQSFALLVTAEPYYAVRRPSNVVVLENVIRPDTAGSFETVNANYELLERGGYVPTGANYEPMALDSKLPLEFFEARNALRIAELAGAERFASSSYENAVRLTKRADGYASHKGYNRKELISVSREAVQTAEDAREIAIKRMESDAADAERRAAADREANSAAKAARESDRRARAEADTADAVRRREEAERLARDAKASAADAAHAQEEAERARAAAERQQRDAEAESVRNRAAVAAAELQRQQAIQEREELRARLLKQFNSILETRDTARGLIVNMSDVLFDTAKHTLRPLAREKLAKISGVMIAYPDLKLEIEGNTDNVGSNEYNQGLSERRAESVRSFLSEQGVAESRMTAKGLGELQPISSNTTAKGRQENRRVELIVSGEVIGTKIGAMREVPSNLPMQRR